MKTLSLVNSALIATTALLATASATKAITIRHDRNFWSYYNLGNYFPNVGYLRSRGCSGTLISNSWVLTAAHCFDTGVSANFEIGGFSYPVLQSIPYYDNPNYSEWIIDDSYSGLDIALLRLSQPVTNVIPANLYTGTNEVGNIGTIVGFGRTGTGLTGNIYSSGTKLAAQNSIDAVGVNGLILTADFDNPSGTSNSSPVSSSIPLYYEGSHTKGDSGGALFINGQLAGVNSFVVDFENGNANADYGDIMGFTRVSPYINWISNVINGQPITYSGSYPQNNGSTSNGSRFGTLAQDISAQATETVPEPPISIALFSLLGMLGFLRCR